NPRFNENGTRLSVLLMGSYPRWTYDAVSGIYLGSIEDWRPEPATDGRRGNRLIAESKSDPLLQLWWDSEDLDRGRSFVCVTQDGQIIIPWRPMPHNDSSAVPNAEFVPGKTELVISSIEPTVLAISHWQFLEQLPAAIRQHEFEPRLRWHDWKQ